MNKQQIKVLEGKIERVTGWDNVEIVLPVSMQDLPSLDYRLLEMENKLNVSRNRMTPRQAKKEAKLAARNNMMNQAVEAFDSVFDVMEEPKRLLNIKPIGAIANYFFLLDDEEEDTHAEDVQQAPPAKEQNIKEGKVIHFNFNK